MVCGDLHVGNPQLLSFAVLHKPVKNKNSLSPYLHCILLGTSTTGQDAIPV